MNLSYLEKYILLRIINKARRKGAFKAIQELPMYAILEDQDFDVVMLDLISALLSDDDEAKAQVKDEVMTIVLATLGDTDDEE